MAKIAETTVVKVREVKRPDLGEKPLKTSRDDESEKRQLKQGHQDSGNEGKES